MRACQRPADALPGQATLHVGVAGDVILIVVIHEAVGKHATKRRPGQRDQKQGDKGFGSVSAHGGCRQDEELVSARTYSGMVNCRNSASNAASRGSSGAISRARASSLPMASTSGR